jgi:hypothetical protein
LKVKVGLLGTEKGAGGGKIWRARIEGWTDMIDVPGVHDVS